MPPCSAASRVSAALRPRCAWRRGALDPASARRRVTAFIVGGPPVSSTEASPLPQLTILGDRRGVSHYYSQSCALRGPVGGDCATLSEQAVFALGPRLAQSRRTQAHGVRWLGVIAYA